MYYDCKTEIENIYKENESYYKDDRGQGMLRGMLRNFPHEWLYICELIQNAIDVNAKNIKVNSCNDEFVFEHDGAPFVYKNVRGLCTLGLSSKGVSTVGFMGIGFKSVFRCFEKATIYSGDYKFSLLVKTIETKLGPVPDIIGSVLPIWDEGAKRPSEGMTTRIELSTRISTKSVEQHLEEVWNLERNILPLLAHAGVISFQWNDDVWNLGTSTIEESNSKGFLLTAQNHYSGYKERWVLFENQYHPSDIAKQEFMKHRDLHPKDDDEAEKYLQEMNSSRKVSVFFRVDKNFAPLLTSTAYAYAMLPTDIHLPFKFNIQADWLLMTSRTQMMDIEEKQWHNEIAEQVPYLLSLVVSWLVKKIKNQDKLIEVYNLLPDLTKEVKDSFSQWWMQKVIDGLKVYLKDLEFLPVYNKEGRINFFCPGSVSCLPNEFNEIECNNEFMPWLLINRDIVAKGVISSSILKSLSILGLIQELTEAELTATCNNFTVEKWFNSINQEIKVQALYKLWAALGGLDKRLFYFDTRNIPCIPTQKGSWNTVIATKLMSDDYWRAFAKEEWLKGILLESAGKLGELFNIEFSQSLSSMHEKLKGHNYSHNYEYFYNKLSVFKTEELIDKWWDDVSKDPTANFDVVIRFTAYIRANQAQRRNLIKRLFATSVDMKYNLLPSSSVLVTEPYAGRHRSSLFPNLPSLCPDYFEKDLYQGSRTEWREFLENTKLYVPKGKFEMSTVVKRYKYWGIDLSIIKNLTGYEKMPSLRSSKMTKSWNEIIVTSDEYVYIDYDMPEEWKSAVKGVSLSNETVLWMAENIESFRKRPVLLYIPYGGSFIDERTLFDKAPSWMKTLRDTAWVPTKGTRKLLRPAQVLPFYDEVRPDEEVADLPYELIGALQQNGIKFGNEVINAPALKRLEIKGRSMTFQDLYETLCEAIDQIGDNREGIANLLDILTKSEILPYAPGIYDRRTSLSWVVARNSERSDFNKKIVSITDFPEASVERSIYIKLMSLFKIPESVNGWTSLKILCDVWENKRPSEEVRRYMPYAFQYLAEDIENEIELKVKWDEIKHSASVYTRSKGWISVKDAVFNDMKSSDEGIYLSDFTIATPSFFGTEYDQQVKIASFIGLDFLSRRLKVSHLIDGNLEREPNWSERVDTLCGIISSIINKEQDDDDLEVENENTVTVPDIIRCKGIIKVVSDLKKHIDLVRNNKWAALYNSRIYVCGEPHQFAPELSEVIIEILGIGRKTDANGKIKKLTARIGTALTVIDDEAKYLTVLQNICDDYGIIESSSTSEDENYNDMNQELVNDGNAENYSCNSSDVRGEAAAAGETSPNTESNKTTGGGNHVTTSTGQNHVGEDGNTQRKSGGHSSGGYNRKTRRDRDRSLARILESRLSGNIVPESNYTQENETTSEPKSDREYRAAVMEYEKKYGRIPKEMSQTQAGFDIESYDQDGMLIRRIEVKGRSAEWKDEEIVTMSRKQIEIFLTSQEECWLYVVEKLDSGEFRVNPIKNPAKRAKTYEFIATLWKFTIDNQAKVGSDDYVDLPDEEDFNIDKIMEGA